MFKTLFMRQDSREAAHIIRNYSKEDFANVMCMIIRIWCARHRMNPEKAAELIASTMHKLYK